MTASLEALGLADFIDSGPAPDDVPIGDNFLAWRLRPLSADAFAALGSSPDRLSPAQLSYLCWLNTLAPTSHNSMPQRFRLDPGAGAVELWLDRQLVLSASDVRGRQAGVSLGCGVAHMLLGARALGWRGELELLADDAELFAPAVEGQPRLTRVARLRFDRIAGPRSRALDPPAWIELALARKVIRSEYDERVELPAALVDELDGVVDGVDGVALHLLTDGPTRLFIGKFQEAADTTVLNRDKYAVELGAWLREDDDARPRGMRGAEFGLSPASTRRFHRGLLREIELLPDEVAGFARIGNVGMRSASAIAVLSVDADTPARWLAAGEVYEELALRLWRHRLCTAMHAGIVEVEGPNMALRGRLRTRWRPTVLFRIGRPLRDEDWLRPHASRPLLPELLWDEAHS